MKSIRIPRELHEKLEAIAKKRGITVEDSLRLSLREFYELLKAEREGKEVVFLYDYGDKGFVVSMPEDLPRKDSEYKNVKIVSIKMPKNAKYPMPE
ncbi:MAG: ribbon-helix-helix protein, CopG family [Candidatus Bathyarchaeia archaeon]